MSNLNEEPSRVSSPAATGGAGTFFEQHVDAAFLALLLVRGIPPIFVECLIEEVAFQTEHFGRRTDDLLLRCRAGNGRARRLAGQAKRTFTISDADDDCTKTFADFWRDFNNPTVFNRSDDAFAIIVRQGSNVLLDSFGSLLDCARVAPDATDFLRRLQTPGFLNTKAVSYCAVVRRIVDTANGAPISDDDLWQFLRHVYVLSLDLASATRNTESMVRTLLAQTASGPDPAGVADATWNRLLAVASEGMPQAGSYTYERLPSELRSAHAAVTAQDHAALQALRDRTRTLRRTIRGTVGPGVHVPRDVLATDVVNALRSQRIVIVTGQAGTGKSAVANEAFAQVEANHFAFAFRAEEFATAHLDTTFHQASIPLTTERLSGLLAGQGAKLLLIESVERLLEKDTRDAFTDLLAVVRDDSSWQLILTCRDYSLDTVRSSFLDYVRAPYAIIDVPLLSDDELDAAVGALPELRRPASSLQLRRLFRNPYILDKAASMSWPEDAPLPADERAFRQKFWRDVVRDEQHSGQGMPQRRADTFIEVALRRARALDAYAPIAGLDAGVLESLRQRDLIAYDPDSDSLVAPAHDVLEDWAILQWIDDRSHIHGAAHARFTDELGPHPAIRRSYRKWLAELIACDGPRADAFVQAIIADQSLPAYFRDDTFVGVLRAPGAAAFLGRNEPLLLADDAQLLRRVIRLLRVACKTTPTWLPAEVRVPPLFYVPHGDAWAGVLHLVRQSLTQLTPRYVPLIVGLLNDWTGGVHATQPLPEGAVDAAAIAHGLLPHVGDYRSEKSLDRIIHLLTSIPLADEPGFRALLSGTIDGTVNRSVANAVSDTLLTTMQAFAACRDVPDAIIELAERTFYLTDEDVRNRRFMNHDLEIEPLFGLQNCGTGKFSPASAFHGPFLSLLQHHRDQAIDFIIRLMNHVADWYAARRIPRRFIEEPYETVLTFPDGDVGQWCNARLWQLYRGTSVGPYILQCALMALENFLLGLCDSAPADVEPILIRLLRESHNVAVSAVVASIANAHPQIAGSAALALLGNPDFILLDRMRMVAEASSPSRVLGMFPQRGENQLFAQERKDADAHPHRRHDLEWTALQLQGTALRPRVQQILDEHRGHLPAVDEQTDQDRIWRIAIHRMDLRQYTAQVVVEEPPTGDDDATSEQPRRILMRSGPLDADIQAMIDRDAPAEAAQTDAMSLFMWAFGVFDRNENSTRSADQWRARLAASRTPPVDDPEDAAAPGIRFRQRGVEFTAAVCVRDHWDEMPDEERAWCIHTLCQSATVGADSADELLAMQRGGMDSSRAAALVLPLILAKPITDAQRLGAVHALAVCLTHAADEVVEYAVEGIRRYLWPADPELCRVCIGALARSARALDQRLEEQSRRRWTERTSAHLLEREIAEEVRREIVERTPPSVQDVHLDSDGWYARQVGLQLLSLLANQTAEPLAHVLYSNAVQQLIRAEANRHDHHNRRNFEWEHRARTLIARHALRLPEQEARALINPILDSLPANGDGVAEFVEQLIFAEDELAITATFWSLWQAVADRSLATSWPQRLADRHGEHDKLLRHLFLNVSWNDGVRDWSALTENAHRILQLFLTLPAVAPVFDAYVNFLYSVGSKSLPWAFIAIASKLQQGNARHLLAIGNTVTGLEILLMRYVYAVPAFLKANVQLRGAILSILDQLVEAGSSAAYRMRDDFVTPSPTGADRS
jgi:hypothetical protein